MQLAPRIATTLQDHATTRPPPEHHLIRDHHHMDPNGPSPPYTAADQMQHVGSSPPEGSHADHGQLDSMGMTDDAGDGRKGYGKRELSTSKRAAQNRAAQRAFRQRKEGYIKKLEEQVRDYQILSENFKQVQQENYILRDYIINLQSRLLESQGEVPPPPQNLEGLQPGQARPSSQQQPPPPPPPPASLAPSVPSQQVATLPRLSELGALAPPPPSSMADSTPPMTAAQTALQAPSILHSPPSR